MELLANCCWNPRKWFVPIFITTWISTRSNDVSDFFFCPLGLILWHGADFHQRRVSNDIRCSLLCCNLRSNPNWYRKQSMGKSSDHWKSRSRFTWLFHESSVSDLGDGFI